MLDIGAKGFAKELIEILLQYSNQGEIFFYDDVNEYEKPYLFDKFRILTTLDEAEDLFKKGDKRFVLGVGNPNIRKLLADKFTEIGG
ncbi:PglD-related sugar-binding protein [Robertkochia flava]|uniref:PglD-related sugar-binding protein n=1 Tax=Robertkochia flava TaxID=3447986 RepID=UPI001CCA91EF|nr:hypothetical protein [Robertkochia marina]